MVILQNNYDKLKEIAIRNGMSLFGVANLEGLESEYKIEPESVYKGLKYGVSMGYHLSDRILESIIDKPTQMYLFHYKRVNALLDDTALRIVAHIQDQGYDALPIHASQVASWTPPMTGHVSHKMIAKYAGLGWIGRSILLVNPTYGGRVRYVSVLTDMPLKIDEIIENDCGSCKACISACPAGAIKENPADFDLQACYQQLDYFRKKENLGQHICGLCVKACFGKKTKTMLK